MASDMQMLMQAVGLHQVGRLDEAGRLYHTLLQANPRNHQVAGFLGTIFLQQDKLTQAIELFRSSLAGDDRQVMVWCNLGVAHKELGEVDEATACFTRAVELQPDYLDALWNLAWMRLLKGDFEAGWRLHEHRFDTVHGRAERQALPVPQWSGKESLNGKTILLRAEQGFGDAIQFARYAEFVKQSGATVWLEVQPGLVPLLKDLKGVDRIFVRGEPVPRFDFHSPLLSLPLALQTRVETVPASIPYLWAKPSLKARWSARLGAKTRPRIGLVWSGNAAQMNDRNRSMSAECLSPLLDLPFDFHCLQREIRSADAAFLRTQPHVEIWSNELNDFSETAALVDEMDVVLSVCTSVAHLAGAMGKPLWLMLSRAADFRWLLEREDSPWYPTARLFRQTARGDWASLVAAVRLALLTELVDEIAS